MKVCRAAGQATGCGWGPSLQTKEDTALDSTTFSKTQDDIADPQGEDTVPDEASGDGVAGDWFIQKAKKLDRLLAKVEDKLENEQTKASVGDFIRLLQLRKEIEDERPRKIEVRWVEQSEEGNAPV